MLCKRQPGVFTVSLEGSRHQSKHVPNKVFVHCNTAACRSTAAAADASSCQLTSRLPSSNRSQAYSEWAQWAAGGPCPIRDLPRIRSYWCRAAGLSPRSKAHLAIPRKACCRMDRGEEPDVSLNAESPSVTQPVQATRPVSEQCGGGSSGSSSSQCTVHFKLGACPVCSPFRAPTTAVHGGALLPRCALITSKALCQCSLGPF